MLSRIAESLFWIGRYVERADDTARILDVHLQMLLEDPQLTESDACRALLAVMGLEPDPEEHVDRVVVLDRLAFDATYHSAIVGSLGAARENARRARETVSTDMWQALNTTWIGIDRVRRRATTAHDFFAWVRERAALVAGIADETMSRDDTWRFLVLGRSLERADMTARLVATSTISSAGPSWTTLLRSCGAYQSYLRTYRGVTTNDRAAEFLLLDRLFPRSVLHALMQAEECLEELAPPVERVGVADTGRRLLGRIRTSLEYRPLAEVVDDLPEEMEKVQQAISAASDAVARRYFPRAATTRWVGEVS
ncbi:MAG: alpha-E domain-containing protein [Kineosporiaceae bacterium]